LEQEQAIAYLSVAKKQGIPGIILNTEGEKVSLTSSQWNESGYWITFKNDSIDWNDYDRICLKVDYDENTTFDQSAMLKLRLNNTILCRTDRNVIQLGEIARDLYLKQAKGLFYYQFENIALGNDNEIQITLNKGRWQNFCIELALIKKHQN